jgi:hypothetical protein
MSTWAASALETQLVPARLLVYPARLQNLHFFNPAVAVIFPSGQKLQLLADLAFTLPG